MSYVRGPGVQHWHSIDNLNSGTIGAQNPFAGGTWPTANLAIYVPLVVKQRVVVKQLWFGADSAGTGNYDIGLYDAAGVALVRRGSTAHPAALKEEVWNCTDTTIGPGIYYIGLSASNATDGYYRIAPAVPMAAAVGVFSEALGSVTLPATATFAVPQTLAFIPLVGMYRDTRVT